MTGSKCALRLMLMAACGVCAADEIERLLTNGMANGRWWHELGSVGKVGYVAGACQMEEVKRAELKKATAKNPTEFCPTRMTYRDIIDAIDAFYDEAENRSIPVFMAMFFVKEKVEGASQSKLEALKSMLRKTAQENGAKKDAK